MTDITKTTKSIIKEQAIALFPFSNNATTPHIHNPTLIKTHILPNCFPYPTLSSVASNTFPCIDEILPLSSDIATISTTNETNHIIILKPIIQTPPPNSPILLYQVHPTPSQNYLPVYLHHPNTESYIKAFFAIHHALLYF